MSKLDDLLDSESATPGYGREVLGDALEATFEVMGTQFDIDLSEGSQGEHLEPGAAICGSAIPLTKPSGGFYLLMVGNARSCENLTRTLFMLEDEEEVEKEDMADALGEIVNIVAGALKTKRGEAGEDLQLGLPLFVTGSDCLQVFAQGLYGVSQIVSGEDDLSLQIILICEGSQG
jgi:hypothetical protein